MNKFFHFTANSLFILALTGLTGYAFGIHNVETKTIVYVELDINAKKAHSQLKILKNMDVLGVNLKKHWAKLAVTKEELVRLNAKNLHFRIATKQLNKLSISSDGYLNPEQVVQALGNIHAQYPNISRLFEFGKTHELRSMMAMEISAHQGDTDKPVVIFNAMHHAREVMTTEIVMHIAKVLTENYGKDEEVTHWLDNYRIILVPQVNPDGNALVSNGKTYEHTMWRKNAYPLQGNVVGVDLNRNYPASWNSCNGSEDNPYSEIYRGPAPGSEPETQAMMQLASTYKPVAEISYHAFSELILYPFGCSNVNNPAKMLFHSIGQDMNAKIYNDDNQTNAYEVGTAPDILYEVDGSGIDWLWKEQGVFSFVIEVNAEDFHPDYDTWRNITVQRQEGGWKALLNRLSRSGFRAHIKTLNPDAVRYSVKKIVRNEKMAFDADAPKRTFPLRSASGLLFQLTEKGRYEVTFFSNNLPIKSLTINVEDTLVDLGEIII